MSRTLVVVACGMAAASIDSRRKIKITHKKETTTTTTTWNKKPIVMDLTVSLIFFPFWFKNPVDSRGHRSTTRLEFRQQQQQKRRRLDSLSASLLFSSFFHSRANCSMEGTRFSISQILPFFMFVIVIRRERHSWHVKGIHSLLPTL